MDALKEFLDDYLDKRGKIDKENIEKINEGIDIIETRQGLRALR